jgi:hypothetical protein
MVMPFLRSIASAVSRSISALEQRHVAQQRGGVAIDHASLFFVGGDHHDGPALAWREEARPVTKARSIATAYADDLPKELLLQCEGQFNLLWIAGTSPLINKEHFNNSLRLKNGSIRNVDNNYLYGENCVLADGVIQCDHDEQSYSKETNATVKSHTTVSLSRVTGELRIVTQSSGTRASGKPSGTGRTSYVGVCRAVGKPIF